MKHVFAIFWRFQGQARSATALPGAKILVSKPEKATWRGRRAGRGETGHN
jgi:hypothetical protein